MERMERLFHHEERKRGEQHENAGNDADAVFADDREHGPGHEQRRHEHDRDHGHQQKERGGLAVDIAQPGMKHFGESAERRLKHGERAA